jgi:ABC-type protease/lipase transport system fused ATPase/permease subunit
VFGDPRLVVLDEPNSNLDNEGELALIRTIAGLKERGATVILVSHRASALNAADIIGIMREGVLERFGPRDAILHDLKSVASLRGSGAQASPEGQGRASGTTQSSGSEPMAASMRTPA